MSNAEIILGAGARPAPSGRAQGGPGGDDVISETTTQNFAKDVLEASRTVPVLVDFWAPWCGPCRQLTPILEKVVRELKGAVKLVKMNIDDHPAIAGQLGIRSIPAVIVFRNGQPIDGFTGAVPESQIRDVIARAGGNAEANDFEEVMLEAQDLLANGDPAGAANLYAAILQTEQEHIGALAGLARCYLELDRLEDARKVLAMVPAQSADAAEILAVQKAIELHELAADAGDVAELERQVAADPANNQARFDLALALAANDRGAAVEQLIEIMRRDREWEDDGARKQLLTFFDAWGPKDPATLAGRRRLSSVLFA